MRQVPRRMIIRSVPMAIVLALTTVPYPAAPAHGASLAESINVLDGSAKVISTKGKKKAERKGKKKGRGGLSSSACPSSCPNWRHP